MKNQKIFSKSELALHNSENDCFVSLEGCVYDITKYLDLHPGGKKILLKFAGKDITDIYRRIHGTKDYKKHIADFYKGILED